jgi:hypothetical protein
MRAAGQDPFRGCDLRWIKATNAQVINDWQWAWLPAYQTVVTVHEEELRKRVAPKFYEEYMLGLSHYLAQKIDAGEITPEQFMHAFNAGWKWLNGKTNEEQALLQQNHIVAQQSDTAAWNTLSTIAIGLALVASTALLATATVRASQPALQPPPTPVHCRVLSIGGGMAKVNCY